MQNKFVRDSVTNRKLDEFPNNIFYSISLCSMWPWYEVQWLENREYKIKKKKEKKPRASCQNDESVWKISKAMWNCYFLA